MVEREAWASGTNAHMHKDMRVEGRDGLKEGDLVEWEGDKEHNQGAHDQSVLCTYVNMS